MKRIVLSALVVGALFISVSLASVHWVPSGLDAPAASVPGTNATVPNLPEPAAAVCPNVPTLAPPRPEPEPTPETQVEQRLRGKVIYVTVDVDRP